MMIMKKEEEEEEEKSLKNPNNTIKCIIGYLLLGTEPTLKCSLYI